MIYFWDKFELHQRQLSLPAWREHPPCSPAMAWRSLCDSSVGMDVTDRSFGAAGHWGDRWASFDWFVSRLRTFFIESIIIRRADGGPSASLMTCTSGTSSRVSDPANSCVFQVWTTMNSGASQKQNLPHPTFHIPDGSVASCCFKNVLLVAACLMKNKTKGWSVLRGKPTDPSR